ncbi:MAG TPA: nuclear transport factor 2 family protein [Candidatus Binataceae bacterium]|nr:nuclear transport factor 2 family protein [Candidatus Binataceae bacterium]
MSDRDALIEANRAFYRAFESLDSEKMESVWLKDPRIICIHPGWPELAGWGPIMNSWERIFENVFEMKFEIRVVDARVNDGLGFVVVEETLTQRGYEGVVKARVLSTNVFERAGTQWWMVLHHGSPIMAPPGDEPPLQ